MKVTPLKTEPILPGGPRLERILDEAVAFLPEGSVLAVTSKIVSLCEGQVVPVEKIEKSELIRREASYYLPPEGNKYGVTLTIKNNLLIPTAGIDESNGSGHYILWPADPQASANRIRAYLAARFNLGQVGVLITDSRSTPLRRGTSGLGLAHSGFAALRNYVGTTDIFDHRLHFTVANHMEGLAAAAVAVMGEGREQTPLALIEEAPFLEFQPRDPTDEELATLRIALDDDLFTPLFKGVDWQRGGTS